MLSELQIYSQSVPEAKSTASTLEYKLVTACSRGDHKVSTLDCEVLSNNIANGLQFFQQYLDDIYAKSDNIHIVYHTHDDVHY